MRPPKNNKEKSEYKAKYLNSSIYQWSTLCVLIIWCFETTFILVQASIEADWFKFY